MDDQRELVSKKGKDAVHTTISELPDGLRECILDHLPIKDAVKTSILSRKWRYTWTFTKRLDFGNSFFRAIGETTGEKYAGIIDKILCMHRGPIEYVSLHIPKDVRADLIDLSAWVLNWSRKGIQELEFRPYPGMDAKFKISSLSPWLFQCQTLRSLTLACGSLDLPPDFYGFSNLIILSLHGVIVSLDSIETLISRCRQLKKLDIRCQLYNRFNHSRRMFIECANLRTLVIWCHPLETIILGNIPHLCSLSLRCDLHWPMRFHGMTFIIEQFYSLHQLEKLDFDLRLLKPSNGDCPHSLPTCLMNLKSLGLYYLGISKREDIIFLFCLLRSTPGLRTLHIDMFQESNHSQEALEVLQAEGVKSNNLNQLATMDMTMLGELSRDRQKCDNEPMFTLIKILLSSCPVLETSFVTPYWKQEPDTVKLQWTIKLLQFHRLSSNAEVIIKEIRSIRRYNYMAALNPLS